MSLSLEELKTKEFWIYFSLVAAFMAYMIELTCAMELQLGAKNPQILFVVFPYSVAIVVVSEVASLLLIYKKGINNFKNIDGLQTMRLLLVISIVASMAINMIWSWATMNNIIRQTTTGLSITMSILTVFVMTFSYIALFSHYCQTFRNCAVIE